MKLNKSKIALCLLVASASTSSIVAHAESFSTPDSTAVDLAFVAPATASSLLLTPGDFPVAGEAAHQGSAIVKVLNSSNGGAVRLGVGYTPGFPNQDVTSPSNSSAATIHGKNDPTNNLLQIGFGNYGTVSFQTVGGVSAVVLKNSATTQALDVVMRTADVVNADTYTISLDGLVYNP